MKTKISLGVIDDHTLFRQGMSGLLSEQEGLKVVLEASNGMELMDKLKKKIPDVLLMDIQMPEMDGIQATKAVCAKYPDVKVIILTMHDNEQMAYHLMENGASGFLAKDADIEIVIDAIYSVAEKGYYMSEKTSEIMLKGIARKRTNPAFSSKLTDREVEVVKLICAQNNTKEIAEKLCLSPRTVETHKLKILEKIGAKNTAGIVLYALNNNLLDRLF